MKHLEDIQPHFVQRPTTAPTFLASKQLKNGKPSTKQGRRTPLSPSPSSEPADFL